MDEDVIDVSHLSEEEYKQHMRRLQQLHTSPCLFAQLPALIGYDARSTRSGTG